jgi:hypothetical protein
MYQSGHSRPSWAVRIISGLRLIAAMERTSRFGIFMPIVAVVDNLKRCSNVHCRSVTRNFRSGGDTDAPDTLTSYQDLASVADCIFIH